MPDTKFLAGVQEVNYHKAFGSIESLNETEDRPNLVENWFVDFKACCHG